MTPDDAANKILNDWLSKTGESPTIRQDLFLPIVAAIAQAIEECAKVAEAARPFYPQSKAGEDRYDMGTVIAKRIRSLKGTE